MALHHTLVAHDRQHAGHLLSDKLSHFKNSNAIVVATSHGGAVVAYYIAQQLGLPFDVCLCRAIEHPADRKKTIGSVSADAIIIHSENHDIPRDYIHHQIILNQNTLKSQRRYYRSGRLLDVIGKQVILVADNLSSLDSVAATLSEIRRQRPEKVFVAAPVLTPEVFAQLSHCTNDVIYLTLDNDARTEKFYQQHAKINDEEVKALLQMAATN